MIGARNTAYVDKCTCLLPDQKPYRYPDDTRCPTWEPGYTDEITWKLGHCMNGTCVLRSLPEGCIGYPPPKRRCSDIKKNCRLHSCLIFLL
ncbi:hypothetical protein V5799_018756 [Amblyomma americanum]|uniref:Uncharacterized protein n=1 Tax=Amblyomma americanum TaxID=6943 RepID=A0AAQ4EZM7_AMBAM